MEQSLNATGCSVSFSGACADNGTIYPEPYVRRVGLYSDVTEDYLDEPEGV